MIELVLELMLRLMMELMLWLIIELMLWLIRLMPTLIGSLRGRTSIGAR